MSYNCYIMYLLSFKRLICWSYITVDAKQAWDLKGGLPSKEFIYFLSFFVKRGEHLTIIILTK